jgi:hypothetical protein
MQPLGQMAGGGHPRANEPIIVGENGPEVFVPDQPGTVVPQYFEQPYPDQAHVVPSGAQQIQEAVGGIGERINPTNWDAWLLSRPESENIDDQRTAEEIAWDNRVRPKLPPLVQFPAAPEEKRQ